MKFVDEKEHILKDAGIPCDTELIKDTCEVIDDDPRGPREVLTECLKQHAGAFKLPHNKKTVHDPMGARECNKTGIKT